VDDAREELDGYIAQRVGRNRPMDESISLTLNAIFDYAEVHPGVLNAAMTDEAVIDAEGVQAKPLLQRWGEAWAEAVETHGAGKEYDTAIVGQAIIGAIHQVTAEAGREGRKRQDVIDNLSKFLIRALKV
jgi:hypothetical protein